MSTPTPDAAERPSPPLTLKLLNPLERSTIFDIIAVPAIGADPTKTWSFPGRAPEALGVDNNIWRDVMSASVYICEFAPPKDTDQLDDYAVRLLEQLCAVRDIGKRPLHFAAHSVGGLIVKKALVLARQSLESIHRSIVSKCFSIAFFGVPHHGSSFLSYEEFLEEVQTGLRLSGPFPPNIRAYLDPRTRDKHNSTDERFAPIAFGLRKIWSFVEGKSIRATMTLQSGGHQVPVTVSRRVVYSHSAKFSSAKLQVGSEHVVELASDHFSLGKFGDMAHSLQFKDYTDELEVFGSALRRASLLDVEWMMSADISLFGLAPRVGDRLSLDFHTVSASVRELLDDGPRVCVERSLTGQEPQLYSSNSNLAATTDAKSATAPRSRQESVPTIVLSTPDHVGGADSFDGTTSITVVQDKVLMSPGSSEAGGTSESDESSQRPIRAERYPSLDSTFPPEPSITQATGVQSMPHGPYLMPPTNAALLHTSRGLSHDDRPVATRPRTVPSRRRSTPIGLESSPVDGQERLAEYEFNIRWIHMPSNVMIWVPRLFQAIGREYDSDAIWMNLLNKSFWTGREYMPRHGMPHGRFIHPDCHVFPRSPDPEASIYDQQYIGEQLCMHFPYLHWDTFANLKGRLQIIKKRMKNEEQVKPLPHEHELIWQHLRDPGGQTLHPRRTLDQYGYPSLASTEARDFDQVLYKRTRPRHSPYRFSPAEFKRSPSLSIQEDTTNDNQSKVIMVDQLWLWVLNRQNIVTFFPREPGTYEDRVGQTDIWNASNDDAQNNSEFSEDADAFDLAAVIVYHAVTAFLDQTADEDLQVFRIFEEYISELTEFQTKSFKEFRDIQARQDATGTMSREPIKSSSDLTSLIELRDIRDELSTLDRLFQDQLKVISSLKQAVGQEPVDGSYASISSIRRTQSLESSPVTAVDKLIKAQQKVEEYQAQVKGMLDRCKLAETAYESLLEMKQQQSNIDEALQARRSGELAAMQSRAVLVFTFITIIFSPLSFFTSFFGMNVIEWGDGNRVHTIAIWSGTISASVIVAALLMAYSKQMWDYASVGSEALNKPITGFYTYAIREPVLLLVDGVTKLTHRHSALQPGVQAATDAFVAVAMPRPWRLSTSSEDERMMELQRGLSENERRSDPDRSFLGRMRRSSRQRNSQSIA